MVKQYLILLVILFSLLAYAVEAGCAMNEYACEGPDKPISYGPCDSTVCTVCPKSSLAYKESCVPDVDVYDKEGIVGWTVKFINYVKNALLSVFGLGRPTRNCIASIFGDVPECSDDNGKCERTTVNNRLLGECTGVNEKNECIRCT